MARRGWHRILVVFVAGLLAGCGGTDEGGGSASPGAPQDVAPGGPRGVAFIGFDASEPLIDALGQGKIQGLVVQNPVRMSELGVKTMVRYLEKQPVEAKIPTGETLVTPENYKDPQIDKLIHPPQAENTSGASLSGTKTKKWKVI